MLNPRRMSITIDEIHRVPILYALHWDFPLLHEGTIKEDRPSDELRRGGLPGILEDDFLHNEPNSSQPQYSSVHSLSGAV